VTARALAVVIAAVGVLAASHASADDQEVGAWVGINPLAPLNDVHHSFAYNTYMPLVTDMEYGVALQGGWAFLPRHAADARFSLGWPHGGGFSTHTQLQLGYRWAAVPFARREGAHLYVGGGVRWWTMRYRAPGVRYHTIAVQALVGTWWPMGPFYVDVRLALMLAGLSWSSAEQTQAGADWLPSPAPGLFPVVPLLGVGVGYRF
jgi:hypothetical protein